MHTDDMAAFDPAIAVEAGLTGANLKHHDKFRVLLAFAGAKPPSCRVIPKITELGHDIIGPAPIGEQTLHLLETERPELVNLRIDEPSEEMFGWISRLWKQHRTPTVVVTMSDDRALYVCAAHAGAMAIIREDSDIRCVEAGFAIAAQRGAALREAQTRVAQLERNLANRRLVEQAKWVLIQRDGLDEPAAHLRLQGVARSTRTPLADVAQSVLDGASLPAPSAG